MTSKKLHSFENNEDQWYVEEPWANDALFKIVPFEGPIYDPCCGGGNIPMAAERAGYVSMGTDIADRGYGPVQDFFQLHACPGVDIVSNPPYGPQFRINGRQVTQLELFIDHALKLVQKHRRVAVFTRLAFLAGEGRYSRYTNDWPLEAVLVCSKRVNCLPGGLLLEGVKPEGGAIDYCWLVFKKGFDKTPRIGFLHPEGEK